LPAEMASQSQVSAEDDTNVVNEQTELQADAELNTAVVGAPTSNHFDAAYDQLRADVGTNILEHMEREMIARALEESGGKQVKAAEIVGMTRATLRKRIDQYDLGK